MAGITAYGKQLRPRVQLENPLVKINSFFVESSLSKGELEKPAGAGPNSGRPRIEIFADKIKKGEEHILNDGGTIVIKQITMDGKTYSPKDMDNLVAAFIDELFK